MPRAQGPRGRIRSKTARRLCAQVSPLTWDSSAASCLPSADGCAFVPGVLGAGKQLKSRGCTAAGKVWDKLSSSSAHSSSASGFLFRAKSVPLRLRSSPPLCPLPFKRASWALMVTARTDGTGLSVTVRGRQLFSVTRARAATTSVPLGITLLERLTEFRETHIYQLLKGYEKGHRCTSRWRDTRARFGRVLSTGASAPGDLGGASPPPPRPVCGCSPTWRIPESPTIGIPWRLPHGE